MEEDVKWKEREKGDGVTSNQKATKSKINM